MLILDISRVMAQAPPREAFCVNHCALLATTGAKSKKEEEIYIEKDGGRQLG